MRAIDEGRVRSLALNDIYKRISQLGDCHMEIQLRRTGERRYGVTILRSGHVALEMNPAPGYNARMPHDLLHLVVEQELALSRGIFGQIADGGTAGTFHLVSSDQEPAREASRRRRRIARRAAKLMSQGQHDLVVSEQAAWICLREWMGRTDGQSRGTSSVRQLARPDSHVSHKRGAETDVLTRQHIDRVCDRLDELSAEWMKLEIGEALTVRWPE